MPLRFAFPSTPRRHLLPGALVTGSLLLSGFAHAAGNVWTGGTDAEWNTTTDGNWTSPTTWTNGDSAVFTGAAPGAIDIDAAVSVAKGVNDDNTGAGDNAILITADGYSFTGNTLTIAPGSGDVKLRVRGGAFTTSFDQLVHYTGTSDGTFRVEPGDGSTATFNGGLQSGNIEFGRGTRDLQLGWFGNGTINLTDGDSYGFGVISAQTLTMSGTASLNSEYFRAVNGSMSLSGSATIYQGDKGRGNGIIVGKENNSVTLTVNDSAVVDAHGGLVLMNINGNQNQDETGTLQVNNGRVNIGYRDDFLPTDKGYLSGLTLTQGDSAGTNATTFGNAVVNIAGGVVTTSAIHFGGTANSVDGTITTAGKSATLNVTGGALYIGEFGISKTANGPVTTAINLSGGTVGAVDSNWSSSMDMTLGTTNGSITFKAANEAGDTGYDIALSGVLSGPGGLIKTGSGMLTLSGANTYTGNTVVNEGTFNLASTGELTFDINATGVNTMITGTGTAVFDGAFVFDLSGADPAGSWMIVDGSLGSVTFGGTFTVDGWADAGGGLWTLGDYTFNENTGVLTAVPEPETWGLVILGGLVAVVMVRRGQRAV